MSVSRREVANTVATRLAAVSHIHGYYGQIGRSLPGREDDTPTDPPRKSPHDPRVAPYFVLYPSAGTTDLEPDLAQCGDDLTMTHRITVAGGDIEDVLAAVDRVHTALYRWEPTIPTHECGPLAPPVGYEPPLLTDLAHEPARLYLPLQYVHTVTAHHTEG